MSIEAEKRPKPLTEQALRSLLARALRKGLYRESFHAEHEHPERNISTEDVVYGLERRDWTLAAAPNYDTQHKTWEYLIKTKDLEGNDLHIKLAVFPQQNRFEVITRW